MARQQLGAPPTRDTDTVTVAWVRNELASYAPTVNVGGAVQVVDEALSGIQDGMNAVFTTASPYLANTVTLFRNGLREHRGVGFTESGPGEITLSSAPTPEDVVSVDYWTSA